MTYLGPHFVFFDPMEDVVLSSAGSVEGLTVLFRFRCGSHSIRFANVLQSVVLRLQTTNPSNNLLPITHEEPKSKEGSKKNPIPVSRASPIDRPRFRCDGGWDGDEGGGRRRSRRDVVGRGRVLIGEELAGGRYFGWVYHLGVNSIGHEYCHLRYLVLKGPYVAMYKRDHSNHRGIVSIDEFWKILKR
ncbi:hypothetical protein B296_00047943 [Ensete ventricosum]|uniref:Uncharacterized protein n=1 Tax=Ensete ventricosum TaxID=4639 RepID=A0A426XC27_ENSVE|nr:hypothetical protein B296_00047943 [Ensete ventricosum]